jgi:hypothetical protein
MEVWDRLPLVLATASACRVPKLKDKQRPGSRKGHGFVLKSEDILICWLCYDFLRERFEKGLIGA